MYKCTVVCTHDGGTLITFFFFNYSPDKRMMSCIALQPFGTPAAARRRRPALPSLLSHRSSPQLGQAHRVHCSTCSSRLAPFVAQRYPVRSLVDLHPNLVKHIERAFSVERALQPLHPIVGNILGSPSDGEPKNEVATFLDCLSEAALENVARYLSFCPTRAEWVAFVALQDAMSALHRSSALADVARRHFTRFCISGRGKVMGHSMMSGEHPSLLLQWIQVVGKSMESLRLDYSLKFLDFKGLLSLMDMPHESCLSLHKLDLRNISAKSLCTDALLYATRGHVSELAADGDFGSQIAKHCHGLLTLIVRGRPMCLPDILKTVGPTLTKFESRQW